MICKKIILNEFLCQKSGFTLRSLENSCFENLEYFGITETFLRHIDVTGKIENIFSRHDNIIIRYYYQHYCEPPNKYLAIISEG